MQESLSKVIYSPKTRQGCTLCFRNIIFVQLHLGVTFLGYEICIFQLFYEEILKTIQPAQRPTNAQVAYIDRCVEVCWIMATQNTPMHLEFCNKGDRPSSLFRPFTRMGNAVQNCVWPALFLHKDGPLLEKGVAHLG